MRAACITAALWPDDLFFRRPEAPRLAAALAAPYPLAVAGVQLPTGRFLLHLAEGDVQFVMQALQVGQDLLLAPGVQRGQRLVHPRRRHRQVGRQHEVVPLEEAGQGALDLAAHLGGPDVVGAAGARLERQRRAQDGAQSG